MQIPLGCRDSRAKENLALCVTALRELGYECGDGRFTSQQAKTTLLLTMAKKMYMRHGMDLDSWLDAKVGEGLRKELQKDGDAAQARVLEGLADSMLPKFQPGTATSARERAIAAMKALEKDKKLGIPHLLDFGRDEDYPAPDEAFQLYLRAAQTLQLARDKVDVPSKPMNTDKPDASTPCAAKLRQSQGLVYSVDVPYVNLKAIFAAKGHQILSVSQAGWINIWSFPGGKLEYKMLGHTGPVYDCDWSVMDVLASGSHDCDVILWDVSQLDTGAHPGILGRLKGHREAVRSVCFNGPGTQLASASYDKTVRIWEVAGRTCLHVLKGHTRSLRVCSFHPKRDIVASSGDDGVVKVWDTDRGKLLRSFADHSEPVFGLTFYCTDGCTREGSPESFYDGLCSG